MNLPGWLSPEFAHWSRRPVWAGVGLLARLVLGGLFIWAGVLKLRDPILFLQDIRSFHLLGDPWAAWLAMALPPLEILAGLALFTAAWRGGLLVLSGALVMFLGALGLAWQRGIDPKCGCFGEVSRGGTTVTLMVQDLLLLGVAALIALTAYKLTAAPAAPRE